MEFALALTAMIGGFVMLAYGADRMIVGATALARRLRMSEAIIGATVVAGGTSLPELMASLQAALSQQYGMAVGNVVGSNIINIALGIGLVSIFKPIHISAAIARRDWLLLAISTVFLCMLGFFLHAITLLASLTFLLIWLGYVVWSIYSSHTVTTPAQTTTAMRVASSPTSPTTVIAIMWFVVGSLILATGGSILVWGAVHVATVIGISDAMIGLTVVTIGTSAPDLVHSILAVHRNKYQLAMGNILGSNVFNIFLILGITGLFGTLPIVDEIRYRDLWWMLGFALVLPLIWGFGRRSINRLGGIALMSGYVVYLIFLGSSVFG